jgi:hypothetical protein
MSWYGDWKPKPTALRGVYLCTPLMRKRRAAPKTDLPPWGAGRRECGDRGARLPHTHIKRHPSPS